MTFIKYYGILIIDFEKKSSQIKERGIDHEKTYVILVNREGKPGYSGTRVTVQAESEFEAMQIAIRRAGVPNGQVAEIKQI